MLKKYSILSVALALSFAACGSSDAPTSNTNTENKDAAVSTKAPKTESASTNLDPKDEKLNKSIYRSDGFRPGVASEWIQVAYPEGGKKVLAIWHWDTNDEKPHELKIISQEYMDGEITAITGKLIYGADTDTASFAIVENRFTLMTGDADGQEFEQE